MTCHTAQDRRKKDRLAVQLPAGLYDSMGYLCRRSITGLNAPAFHKTCPGACHWAELAGQDRQEKGSFLFLDDLRIVFHRIDDQLDRIHQDEDRQFSKTDQAD